MTVGGSSASVGKDEACAAVVVTRPLTVGARERAPPTPGKITLRRANRASGRAGLADEGLHFLVRRVHAWARDGLGVGAACAGMRGTGAGVCDNVPSASARDHHGDERRDETSKPFHRMALPAWPAYMVPRERSAETSSATLARRGATAMGMSGGRHFSAVASRLGSAAPTMRTRPRARGARGAHRHRLRRPASASPSASPRSPKWATSPDR
jgi:hypothetical protein